MTKGWDRMDQAQKRRYTLRFIEFMKAEIPGCRIAFKDDPPQTMPWWHRVAHWAGALVAREYHTRYTTVIHKTIYFPAGTRETFEKRPQRWYSTLRHEFVHLKDFDRFHLLMGASYVLLLPTIWTMRSFWELRGYAQNMMVLNEGTGRVPESEVERLAEIFSSRDYGFMLWPRSRARRALATLRQEVCSGQLQGPYPYGPLRTPVPEPIEEEN